MNPKSKVYIELTEAQKEVLLPLFEKVAEATYNDKPIMLLSQIMMTNDGDVVAICNVTSNEEAIELQKLLSPKLVGKVAGNKYFEKALRKARER